MATYKWCGVGFSLPPWAGCARGGASAGGGRGGPGPRGRRSCQDGGMCVWDARLMKGRVLSPANAHPQMRTHANPSIHPLVHQSSIRTRCRGGRAAKWPCAGPRVCRPRCARGPYPGSCTPLGSRGSRPSRRSCYQRRAVGCDRRGGGLLVCLVEYSSDWASLRQPPHQHIQPYLRVMMVVVVVVSMVLLPPLALERRHPTPTPLAPCFATTATATAAAATSLRWPPPTRGLGRRVDKEVLWPHVCQACVRVFVSICACVLR